MFEEKTYAVIAAYEVHDTDEGRSYEFMHWRARYLNAANWREKLAKELEFALKKTSHAVVVAYEKCDESLPFEGNGYAVVAYEQDEPRPVMEWVADEIAEEVCTW